MPQDRIGSRIDTGKSPRDFSGSFWLGLIQRRCRALDRFATQLHGFGRAGELFGVKFIDPFGIEHCHSVEMVGSDEQFIVDFPKWAGRIQVALRYDASFPGFVRIGHIVRSSIIVSSSDE